MEKIKAYKGFDKDLTCRGFQYEIGKEYEQTGEIKCCNNGFHACESPLEVFDHYDMLNSRFAEVEQYGDINRKKDTTKVASSKIRIKAELKLTDMIKLGIDWLIEKTRSTDSGDYAKIGSSGYGAKISSTGCNSVIMCAGRNSIAQAKKGSWITLAEWVINEKKEFYPKCVKTEYVDGERIKEDTFYKLINGEFVEQDEQD